MLHYCNLGAAPLSLPFLPGPDGAVPIEDSNWAAGIWWFEGQLARSPDAWQALAGASFARASHACRFNAAGDLEMVAPDVARLDHDPATGEALGYRAEGRRTNLWRTDPAQESLFSGQADERGVPLRRFAGNGQTVPSWSDGNGRWQDGAVPVASVCARRGSERYLMLGLSGTTTSGQSNAAFDFDAGAFSFAGTLHEFSARELGGGLWRLCVSTANGDVSPSLRGLRIRPSDGGSSQAHVLPEGATVFWGAPQLELGTSPPGPTFASTPIPWLGGEVTREADRLSWPVAAPASATMLVRAQAPSGTDGDQVLWQWDDGSDASHCRVARGGDGRMRVDVAAGGVQLASLDLGPVQDDAELRLALAWEEGRIAASLDGATAVAAPITVPQGLVTLRAGTDLAGRAWFGTIARLTRHAAAYADAQLAEMSR